MGSISEGLKSIDLTINASIKLFVMMKGCIKTKEDVETLKEIEKECNMMMHIFNLNKKDK